MKISTSSEYKNWISFVSHSQYLNEEKYSTFDSQNQKYEKNIRFLRLKYSNYHDNTADLCFTASYYLNINLDILVEIILQHYVLS